MFIRRRERGGGGGLLALRPTHPKKNLTQNLSEGKSLNKRPFGTQPGPTPLFVLIPDKQSLGELHLGCDGRRTLVSSQVGRIFFYVGASAGTIAKTISAYDMTMSDTLYGDCDRFVTLQRLEQMVDAEYEELEKTLRAERPDTRFFAFADTVVAKKYGQDNECHGWMGLKFQLKPDSAPVRVLVHARLLDKTMQEQQNALGILGTNLMHACFYQLDGLLQVCDGGAVVDRRIQCVMQA